MQNGFKILLDSVGLGANVAAGHTLERFLGHLCDRLSCKGFPCAGSTVQKNDEAVTFAFNDVGPLFSCNLVGDKSLHEFLRLRLDDQMLQGSLVQLNLTKIIDIEVHCMSSATAGSILVRVGL
jgi:hypothetical protein